MAIQTFQKKFGLPLWLFFFIYILFQVSEIVNNSDSEIKHTDNLHPGYKHSFIVKLDLSLRSTAFDLCPYHQKCLAERKRDILLRAWQEKEGNQHY